MRNLFKLLFIIVIAASLLSQLPFFYEVNEFTGKTVPGSFARGLQRLWAIPTILVLMLHPSVIFENKILKLTICVFLFLFYCAILESFTQRSYLGADVKNIILSYVIMFVSYKSWTIIHDRSFLNLLVLVILFSGFLLALFVFFTSLIGIDLSSRIYAFGAKNSMGQILLCCSLIPLLLFTSQSKFHKLLLIGCISFMTIVSFMMKSRATIAGYFFVILYFIFKSKNRKLKIVTILVVVSTVMYICLDKNAYEIIVNGILFAGRNVDDINDLSSNRIELAKKILPLFEVSPFFGNGNIYFDCMPIIMVIQYGIIGSIPIFALLYIVFIVLLNHKKTGSLYETTFLVFCSFLVNCLFEAQPPFGPGAKCCLLWIFVGFSLSQMNKEIIR